MSRAREIAERGHHLSPKMIADVNLHNVNLNATPNASLVNLTEGKDYRFIISGDSETLTDLNMALQLRIGGTWITTGYGSSWMSQGAAFDGGFNNNESGIYVSTWTNADTHHVAELVLCQGKTATYYAGISGHASGFTTALQYFTGTISGYCGTPGLIDGVRMISIENGRVSRFRMQAYEMPEMT